MADDIQNYTLGRGKVYLSRFQEGTRIPAGFRYIGNSPEFSVSIESENLDHFSSDGGIREKDDSVPLETTRTSTLTTDNIDPDNMAIFFFGEGVTLATQAASDLSDTITAPVAGLMYKIGLSEQTPSGVRGLDPEGTTFTQNSNPLADGVDYTLDAERGQVVFHNTEEGSFESGTPVDVAYSTKAVERSHVISGSRPVEGAMMYEAHNPKGRDYDYFMPYVRLTPNGDFALKGDEWQTIPFTTEILKTAGREAIYLDGLPYAA